jgi:glycine/D-amino acid oxidase-like deaminating enzyme
MRRWNTWKPDATASDSHGERRSKTTRLPSRRKPKPTPSSSAPAWRAATSRRHWAIGSNIYPVKGYSITVELDDAESRAGAPWVSLLDDERKIVSSRLGADRFRVAGTAELNGYNRDIRDVRIDPLIAWTRQLFPSVSTERVIPWAGLRPMTPSMLPRVGAGRRAGVFYNTGHGHLGWTLSAATASIVAEAVDASLCTTATRPAARSLGRQAEMKVR